MDLADRAGIQATVEAVIQLELSGGISPTRSRNVLAALRLASRNFDAPMRKTAVSEEYQPPREIHRHSPRRLSAARESIADNLIPFVRNDPNEGQKTPPQHQGPAAPRIRKDLPPAS